MTMDPVTRSIISMITSGGSGSFGASASFGAGMDTSPFDLFGGILNPGGSSGLDLFSGSSMMTGSSMGGSGFEFLIPLLLNGGLEGLTGSNSSSSGSSSSSSSSSSQQQESTTIVGASDVYLADDFVRAFRNGDPDESILTERFTDMGVNEADAAEAVKLTKTIFYAKELIQGEPAENTRQSVDDLAAVEIDSSKEGDRFAAIASAFIHDGGTFDLEGLAQLLRDNDRRDLANRDGVGVDRDKTLAAVVEAMNDGDLTIRQVFNGPGDNEFVDSATKFANAKKYVEDGGLKLDSQDLENGIANDDKDLIKRISNGPAAGTIRTEEADDDNDTDTDNDNDNDNDNDDDSGVGNVINRLKKALEKFIPILILISIIKSIFGGGQSMDPFAGGGGGFDPFSSGFGGGFDPFSSGMGGGFDPFSGGMGSIFGSGFDF